jgi:hypothetical protein
MSRGIGSKWRGLVVMGASAVMAIVVASGGAAAASMCKKVEGHFTLQSLTGPACSSAVDICATGTYTGDISGSSSFAGTSVVATADTPTTGVILVTGDNTISSRRGTLLTKDAIVLRTTGAGEFAKVDTIVGGTGAWLGTSGVLRATGTFSQTTGGSGRYTGEVCGL